MKKNNIVDLFAGAGGMTLGFEKAGFSTVSAVEFNKIFAATYSANFSSVNMVQKDITKLSDDEINGLSRGKKIDVVIGGPPCQGFSIAGNVGRKFLEDPRNELFKEYVRVVSLLKPKVFVLENVAALERHNKGKTIKEIVNAFSNIGYSVKYKILNASQYGIPQERRRIFVVGTRGNNLFDFPKEDKKVVTIKDAIDDLPPLKSGESSNIPNHVAMNHSKQMLEKMAFVKDGGNRNDIPSEIRPKSGDVRKYIRYDSRKPSPCVTGDMRKIFHYSQNRALTCRELARLQTFPDSFIFTGNSIEIQQQIGNAVPCELAYRIAKEVRKILDE